MSEDRGDCHNMKPLPDSVKKLIEAKTFANIATLMPDGSPHVAQAWVDHDGDLVLINTIEGSQKHKNVSEESQSRTRHLRPRQRLQRGSDPWTRQGGDLQRGRRTCRQAGEKISRTGQIPERRPGMRRVLFKIEPVHILPPFTDTTPRKST